MMIILRILYFKLVEELVLQVLSNCKVWNNILSPSECIFKSNLSSEAGCVFYKSSLPFFSVEVCPAFVTQNVFIKYEGNKVGVSMESELPS